MLMQRFSSLSVWDDAYFFVRYADNFLNYSQLSWNSDSSPTYGLTSPAYLLVVVPLRVLLPNEPALVMLSASLLCGVLSLMIIVRLIHRILVDDAHRTLFWVIFGISTVVAGEHITTHLTSGMDTMFAVMALCIWLGLLCLSQQYIVLGVLSALFLWIRPDVLLIIGGVLIYYVLFCFSHSQSKHVIIGFLTTLVIMLFVNTLYFGHPLPLPFYAKSTVIYGDAFYGYYQNATSQSLIDFIMSFPYLIALFIVGLIRTQIESRQILIAFAIGITLFTIYQTFFVVPVMGFSQRFLYPLLPVLLVGMIYAIPSMVQSLPDSIIRTIQTYSHKVFLIPLLLMLTLINPLPLIVTFVNYTAPQSATVIGVGRFDVETAYRYLYEDNWFGLLELSKLDNDLVIATTEIGIPGVLNPDKQIIDLAGLNNPEMVQQGFSAERLLQTEKPDWIYMPFPHYEDLWYNIFTHPAFESDYQYISAQTLGTSMDVAIRRASPFYQDMLEVVNNYE